MTYAYWENKSEHRIFKGDKRETNAQRAERLLRHNMHIKSATQLETTLTAREGNEANYQQPITTIPVGERRLTVWLKLTNKHTQGAKRTRRMLKSNGSRYIVADAVTTWAHVAKDYSRWASDQANQYRFTFRELPEKPDFSDVQTADCGIEVKGDRSLRGHKGTCKSCKSLRAKQAKQRQPRVDDLPKREPTVVEEPNWLEIIQTMESGLDEALKLAADYEAAINAVKGYLDFDARINELRTQRLEHAKSLRVFSESNG